MQIFKQLHEDMKGYLKDHLVCPFGKKSIQNGQTFFAHRVELAEILENPDAYILTEKLDPYLQYVHKGDGMVISFDTEKKFTFEQRTPQKIFHIRKEVYKAMADVTANYTFALSQYEPNTFKYIWNNTLEPCMGPVHTYGRDPEKKEQRYKNFGAAMQVYDTIGSIPTLQFADDRLDTMMFYMGPEYHPQHPRYLPQSSIIFTKSLVFQNVDQIKGHQNILRQMAKSIHNKSDPNAHIVAPSAYANPDYNQATIDRKYSQQIIKELGCTSREDLTEEAGMRLRNILLAQQ